MKFLFHGHACFELRGVGQPTLLLDPYRPNGLSGRFQLPRVEAAPDLIAITHYHEDHAWIEPEWNHVEIVDQTGSFQSIDFRVAPAYHDGVLGTRMGLSVMLAFEYEGIHCLHLGDLGEYPDPHMTKWFGQPDLVFLPVGGTYTLGGKDAAGVAKLFPKAWIVPMHGAHPGIDLPLEDVEVFLNAWNGPVVHHENSGWIQVDTAPERSTVIHVPPVVK